MTTTIGVGTTMTEAPTDRMTSAGLSTHETNPATPAPVRSRRRRRAAPVGRILAAGLSTSATFGLVAAMAWPDRAGSSEQTAASPQAREAPLVPESTVPPVVVIRRIPILVSGSARAVVPDSGVNSSRGRVAPAPTIATPRRSKPVTTSRGS